MKITLSFKCSLQQYELISSPRKDKENVEEKVDDVQVNV